MRVIHKILTFLILCSSLVIIFAEKPSWYPDNTDALAKNCNEVNEYKYRTHLTLEDPKLPAVFLCYLKAFNVYNEESGIDADRFTYSFYHKLIDKFDCKKPLVKECVNKYKELESKDQMAFKVVECVLKENEGKKPQNCEN